MCNEFIYSEYINAIIGIIGTLLGTLLGWVLNNVSKKGKLNFYVLSWKDEFQHYDKGGICVTSLNRDEAQFYSYTVHLDVYNSCGETKIMRNIQLVFFKNKKEIYRSVPNDETTRRVSCGLVRYDEIVPLNIFPKTVTTLELYNCISKEEFDFILETNKIFLSYIDENNKKKKVFIKKEDYENYFINHNVEEENNG